MTDEAYAAKATGSSVLPCDASMALSPGHVSLKPEFQQP